MHVVLDASIVVTVASGTSDEAKRLRDWLSELIGNDRAHIIRVLTPLEVTSAIRRLERKGEISSGWAAEVLRRMFGWPYVREELTQPQLERAWELRHNFTPYDAAYLAVTESLQSALKERVPLVTADRKLIEAPKSTHLCELLEFEPQRS